jgi:hypothetical protein
MNLQEQTNRIKQMMGVRDTRHNLDFQKLLNNGIIYITQGHDLKTGERIKPVLDPETGEMFDDSTNLITIHNIINPEYGNQDGIPEAMKHQRPDQVDYWQRTQGELSDKKYNQIIKSIKMNGDDVNDYII